MKPQTENKYSALKKIIEEWDKCVVAFSGGCDSTLLLRVTADVLGADNIMAVTARSPSFPQDELEDARSLARSFGVSHIEFDTDELNDPNFSDNTKDRCYYCKRELFEKMLETARNHGYDIVADASNYDDAVSDYRPGLKAIKELGIRSPLREAGLKKEEIRELSRALGVPTHDKPSFACLASRFPYGEKITGEKLDRVGSAERIMKDAGYRQFRVRSHGDLARIELGSGEDPHPLFETGEESVVCKLKALGYIYVALDLEGYRTGSMNEAIGE